ncbi:diaminobutyrate acetyltransferase [Streptomyces sp. SL13]|jgi:L-2,4-diaminobutyric acid acetyltransferase|uniref:L-2,4-diaminobutyric acid acetyltransferase n=1 Tax=Streptantibioticus silvisoli TaxID=2705255 RepID=A0AA90KIY8_9ACTN|nr:diaminobutyrate acetyltransferase [Streptantibioticus silvisoli]MDI5963111.1 diaminobutyrate acetyltransferase [Streptantibioticus silvisoli]MDI5973199.1 diaminobutyrate acetyltransferase [Streptantibioticus silvisoli]
MTAVQATKNSDHLLDHPTVDDGAEMWRIARDSKVLDLNSSYSYLLWCRDFSRTSVVARENGRTVGFVTGYVRPERRRTLVVWQVAVDEAYRGRGLAATMLDGLTARTVAALGIDRMETTIAPDNEASSRLFTSFGERHGATVEREVLFEGVHFPDGHDPEVLHRIGPLA